MNYFTIMLISFRNKEINNNNNNYELYITAIIFMYGILQDSLGFFKSFDDILMQLTWNRTLNDSIEMKLISIVVVVVVVV